MKSSKKKESASSLPVQFVITILPTAKNQLCAISARTGVVRSAFATGKDYILSITTLMERGSPFAMIAMVNT